MKNKKRIYAVFGVLLILSVSVLSAFPVSAYSEPCDNCVDANYDTFCDNCGFDITAHSCPHNNTYTYYESYPRNQHIRVVHCDDCNEEQKYVEYHSFVNGTCECGESCSHDYDYWYSHYNEIQHIADYECDNCGHIDVTYYNYHDFLGNNGNIKCTDCGYVLNSYVGHYVSSISYINGVNYTITTNDSIKQINRDFVTDEYGDFNVTGWCYLYFGVSQYYFEIYENGTLVDVIPALVNSVDTLNVAQKLAVQNRASLGFHYNESWCANSAFNLTAELGRYNGGTYDIVLSVSTGAGVSVQMARFHTVTVEVTKVKETEAPTEEPTEAPTEEPTEAPTEKPSEEPTEKPADRGAFSGVSATISINYLNGAEIDFDVPSSYIPFKEGKLDVGAFVDKCLIDLSKKDISLILIIFHIRPANKSVTTFYISNATDCYIHHKANDNLYTFTRRAGDNALIYSNSFDGLLVDSICVTISDTDYYSGEYNFLLYSVRDDLDFSDMFTGVYDGMLNVFYKMTNFEILGYNIASLILGIFTLIVVIIIAKKVL